MQGIREVLGIQQSGKKVVTQSGHPLHDDIIKKQTWVLRMEQGKRKKIARIESTGLNTRLYPIKPSIAVRRMSRRMVEMFSRNVRYASGEVAG